jgi:hypothetical protein
MSTRGTYKIYDDYNRLDIYFYIHHDNYPEGAAYYFQKMLDYMEMNKEEYVRPTYAEAFFRVNNEAHFTKSHAAHGDTDYQYNILKTDNKGHILQAFEIDRDWKRYNKELAQLNRGNTKPENNISPTLHMTRKKFFEGSVEDFIKTYEEKVPLTETEQGFIESSIDVIDYKKYAV